MRIFDLRHLLLATAWAGVSVGMGCPAKVVADDPQVQRSIRALAEDGSIKVRARAAFVLAEHNASEAVPVLQRTLVEDEAPAVRLAAAVALGRLGKPGSVACLRDALARDRDGAVREAARRALDVLLQGARSTRTLSIGVVEGTKGDARLRSRLRSELAEELHRHGFVVVEGGGKGVYRLKPKIVAVEVTRGRSGWHVELRASVAAIDERGRTEVMVEGGARAGGGTPGAQPAALTVQACDAAVRSISEDLARRLQEGP